MGSQILRVWWEFAVAPRITRRVTVTGGALLVVLALALMTVYLDPATVLERISNADPWLVTLAAVVYAASWPLRGGRYRDILAELGYREGVGFLTGAVFVSQTGNLVFPARAGDAVRAYIVKTRRAVPYPTGFASLAVERVFDLLTITALAGSVLVGFALVGLDPTAAAGGDAGRSGRTALYVAAGVGAAAIVAVLVILASARSDRNLVRRGVRAVSTDSYADWVAGVIEQFVGDVQQVAGDRGAFLRIGASSVAIWSLDVVTALLVFAAFEPGLVSSQPALVVAVGFFAVSVGNLAKVLPLSPGGIGLYEGAFTLLVVGLTPIGAGTALGIAIVDHAVKNVVTVIGGVAATVLLNVSLTTAVEESAEVESEAVARDD
jgi:uncharacterized membrane protein YbhN (UPF0104 family)